MNWWLPGERDSLRESGKIMYTQLYLKWITNVELCSVLCVSLDGRGIWGRMDTYIYMAESLHCSPETTTTLLIGHTLIQIKSLKFENKYWKKKKRILEWVAISYSRGSSWSRDGTRVFWVSCIVGQMLRYCATWEAPSTQCCDSFGWTAKGLCHLCTCIHSPPNSPSIQSAT